MITPNASLNQLKGSIGELQPREKKVLLARLEGGKSNTLGRVGKKMKLTPARVFQIEKSAWDQVVNAPAPVKPTAKVRKTKAKAKKASTK